MSLSMFSFFKKQNKSKYCEFCGEQDINFIYRFIAEVEYLIFLKNCDITDHNQSERYVIVNNKQRVDYSVQTDIDHAVNFKKLIPHIFCSEVCEDRFLNKYSQHFSLSIHEKTYIINYDTARNKIKSCR